MGRKTIVWIFKVVNKQNFTREDLDMDKKGKPLDRMQVTAREAGTSS